MEEKMKSPKELIQNMTARWGKGSKEHVIWAENKSDGGIRSNHTDDYIKT